MCSSNSVAILARGNSVAPVLLAEGGLRGGLSLGGTYRTAQCSSLALGTTPTTLSGVSVGVRGGRAADPWCSPSWTTGCSSSARLGGFFAILQRAPWALWRAAVESTREPARRLVPPLKDLSVDIPAISVYRTVEDLGSTITLVRQSRLPGMVGEGRQDHGAHGRRADP